MKFIGGLQALAFVLVLGATPSTSAARIDDVARIEAAVEAVRQDPNIGAEKTERKLRWKDRQKPVQDETTPAWIKWIGDFVDWINEAARVLVWVLGGIAVVVLLLILKRWLEVRGELSGRARAIVPTHVRDLDIRPESLPDDIGAAAWQRWHTARDWEARRSALSLLYRGALSRLVHVHRVPIRASSTEGECVRLARAVFERVQPAGLERGVLFERVQPAGVERGALIERLVDVWQRAVYGLQAPDDATVRDLCLRFGPLLDRAPAASPAATAQTSGRTG